MKQTKKGFTLVELLVVIAILAILATVSVVGYTSFITRANLSNDQTMIGMINDNLLAASVGNELNTAGDAVNLLKTVNIYGEKLQPFSAGHHYAYSATDKCFVLVDESGSVVYPQNVDGTEIWALYTGNYGVDRVEGVTRYVAVGTVTNGAELYEYGAITLDLAGNVCTASKNPTVNGATAQVQASILAGSGYVTDAGFEGAIVVASAVEKYSLVTEVNEHDVIVASPANFQDVIFDKTVAVENIGSYTFTNCIFTHNVSVQKSANVTFQNCKFIDTADYAITTDGLIENGKHTENQTTGDISILNCEFINCGRGIQLMSAGDVRIEGCTFTLGTTEEKNHVIRWDSQNSVKSLIVKNNTINSAYAVVRVSNQYGVANNPTTITFENNTIGTIGCAENAFAEANIAAGVANIVEWFNTNIK